MATDIECKGCTSGINMCYNRPCFGTPEEFEKIIEAGFAHKLREDYWIGRPDEITQEQIDKSPEFLKEVLISLKEYNTEFPNPFKEDVKMLSGGTEKDINYKASFIPNGKCKLLDENDLCELHKLGLKPEQGRQSCCNDAKDTAKDNLYYAELWSTDKGKEVIRKFRKEVEKKL